jgi:hypothetical protein
MKEQSYKTVWGLYYVIYESKGYWFRTPEAWDITGNFRASIYMRPAGIWAMEIVWSAAGLQAESVSWVVGLRKCIRPVCGDKLLAIMESAHR